MRRDTLISLGALAAMCMLPTTGAFADDQADKSNGSMDRDRSGAASADADTAATGSAVMDPAQFRDALHRVRDLMSQMRENRQLALAAQDPLLASNYERADQTLLLRTLGEINTITANWRGAAVPSSMDEVVPGNMKRYAAESEDTAFVRNTVWDIQTSLESDKLNGRLPTVTKRMMSQIDEAISRAEHPTYRVAKAWDREAFLRRTEMATHEMVAQAPPAPAPTTTTEETIHTETVPAPAPRLLKPRRLRRRKPLRPRLLPLRNQPLRQRPLPPQRPLPHPRRRCPKRAATLE